MSCERGDAGRTPRAGGPAAASPRRVRGDSLPMWRRGVVPRGKFRSPARAWPAPRGLLRLRSPHARPSLAWARCALRLHVLVPRLHILARMSDPALPVAFDALTPLALFER